jgi:integrase
MAEIYEFQCKVKQKCDPALWEADDFLEFANSMISRGVSTDTVRKYLTRWWSWRPDHREKLKGLHGKWVRRGVMKSEEHTLEPEEVRMALESDELTDEEKLYLKLWLTTGAREYSKPSTRGLKELGWGGVVGVKVSDINWKECTISIREPKTAKEEPKEWYGIQLNLFFPGLCEELRRYVEEKGRGRDDWLWGSPEKAVRLYKSIIKKLKSITGKPLVPHDIRRTHAYWLVRADVPLELIAGGIVGTRLMNALGVGWEDISVMIRYYADLSNKSRKYVPHVQQVFYPIFS